MYQALSTVQDHCSTSSLASTGFSVVTSFRGKIWARNLYDEILEKLKNRGLWLLHSVSFYSPASAHDDCLHAKIQMPSTILWSLQFFLKHTNFLFRSSNSYTVLKKKQTSANYWLNCYRVSTLAVRLFGVVKFYLRISLFCDEIHCCTRKFSKKVVVWY